MGRVVVNLLRVKKLNKQQLYLQFIIFVTKCVQMINLVNINIGIILYKYKQEYVKPDIS